MHESTNTTRACYGCAVIFTPPKSGAITSLKGRECCDHECAVVVSMMERRDGADVI